MTPSRTPLLLSILVHATVVAAATGLSAGTRHADAVPLRVTVTPTQEAPPPAVARPRPEVTVTIEREPAEPDLTEPTVAAAVDLDAFAPDADRIVPLAPPPPPADAEALQARVRRLPPPLAAEAASAREAPRVEAIAGEDPPPDYPRLARRRGWQGVVTLRVQVDAAGRATAVEVGTGSGHRVLDDAARDAVARWRFRNGPGETVIEIEFVLREG